jgi:hypothetical protein
MVERDLPFGRSTTNKLVEIAGNPILSSRSGMMTTNPVANAAMIVAQTFSAPFAALAIDLSTAEPIAVAASYDSPPVAGANASTGGALPANTALILPIFKTVFFAVLIITILCGIAELILAAIWEKPTTNQQAAFQAMDFAWKAGLGAILGLLGGKVT